MDLAGRTALLTGRHRRPRPGDRQGARRARRTPGAERPQAPRRWRRWPPSCRARDTRSCPPTWPSPAPPSSSPPRPAPVDVLVANAGLPGAGRLADFSAEEVARALRVNLEAPMLLARALYPAMVERGHRPPRLRLLALGQGRQPPHLDLQRDQVRPARLRPRPAHRPRARRGSASRSSHPASSAKPGCSPTPAPRRRRAWGPRRPEQVGAAVVKAIDADKVEIAVAPLPAAGAGPLRRCSARASPYASQSGSTGQKAAAAVVDGHSKHAKDKR